MDDRQVFLKEAQQYLKAGQGRPGKPSRLSTDIRYNLLALSIEKSSMAILFAHNDLADNHTFSDLLFAIGKHIELPGELRSEILELEQVQCICNIQEYHRASPADSVVLRMLLAAEQLCRVAERECGFSSGETAEISLTPDKPAAK